MYSTLIIIATSSNFIFRIYIELHLFHILIIRTAIAAMHFNQNVGREIEGYTVYYPKAKKGKESVRSKKAPPSYGK